MVKVKTGEVFEVVNCQRLQFSKHGIKYGLTLKKQINNKGE